MGVKITNNASATLAAGISNSATTLTVTSGQGASFPTLTGVDYCWLTLVDTSNNVEVIKCTARSTDSFTIVRAQDNTTARAFAISDRLELRPTAALFNEFANPLSEKGADIGSANPLVITAGSDYFDVTGTTGFASMTVATNRQFTLQFDAALVMTHHATNLDLPGLANITTVAGDVATFQSTGTDTVQCINYTKVDGTAIAGGATPVTALNNATANELVTVGSTTTELDAESGLTFDGNNLTITNGNLILGTAGEGISFSATADNSTSGASTTSELLDDYEEGTWTPNATGGLASLSVTGTCAYTRIGNICYIQAGIGFSGSGTGSGDVEIGGLPFTPVNNSAMRGSISVFLEGAASNWAQGVSGFVQSNQPYFRLRENGSTSSGSNQGNKIDAGTGLMVIAHYRVA